MTYRGFADISASRLKERLDAGERPVLLDVREEWEFRLARIRGSKLAPMSALPGGLEDLDRDEEIVVICHHGARSAHVAKALSNAGFSDIINLEGGLDAYSTVDPDVGRY